MRLLLDTHALLWWLEGNRKLSARVRRIIADDEGPIHVSAASAWEIATKIRLGKLPGVARLRDTLLEAVVAQGFVPLAITFEHGQRAGALAGTHGDPFDRMIAAQAIMEDLPIVTTDRKLAALGARTIW